MFFRDRVLNWFEYLNVIQLAESETVSTRKAVDRDLISRYGYSKAYELTLEKEKQNG